jgi:hypothetical protein
MARHGKPDIFNTDQGSQFTGSTFTERTDKGAGGECHGVLRGDRRCGI